MSEQPDHDPADAEHISSRNSHNGLILFFVYFTLYAGFMALNVYDPKIMSVTAFRGVNVAIIYGFGLIVAALFLAAIYMYLCRMSADGEAPK
jgi:uncharacterized membrane protein (DUF485 family)